MAQRGARLPFDMLSYTRATCRGTDNRDAIKLREESAVVGRLCLADFLVQLDAEAGPVRHLDVAVGKQRPVPQVPA